MSRIDLTRVDVAVGVNAERVDPMELTHLSASAADAVELGHALAVDDVQGAVGEITNIEARLLGVRRELCGDGCAIRIALWRYEQLLDEAALAFFGIGIRTRSASNVRVENLFDTEYMTAADYRMQSRSGFLELQYRWQ